jgi:16S rRNA (cytosine1402-N4)-methyltransferase
VHKSVLLYESLKYLKCEKNSVVLDCTVGYAGHAQEILKSISPHGRLIGIDADRESLKIAKERLRAVNGDFRLVHENFVNFDRVLNHLGIKNVDAILFDLGISSLQLDDNSRGFSFQAQGPLDMRMDREKGMPLSQALSKMTEEQIGSVIRDLGEERHWRKIARAIVSERRISPIDDTLRLAEIIKSVIGYRPGLKINPATRTFQAFRIFINDELNLLKEALLKIPGFLRKGGRVVVISFHSLEDRIVKKGFKTLSGQGILKIITKKPIKPGEKEISENSRSRSGKLRAAEKV